MQLITVRVSISQVKEPEETQGPSGSFRVMVPGDSLSDVTDLLERMVLSAQEIAFAEEPSEEEVA